MRFVEYCEQFKFEPTDSQLLACVWLEARGYEFLIDFGYENAEMKADAVLIGYAEPPYRRKFEFQFEFEFET
jgi:hypothetical protein